jgi:hypothetical protein
MLGIRVSLVCSQLWGYTGITTTQLKCRVEKWMRWGMVGSGLERLDLGDDTRNEYGQANVSTA